MTGEVFVTDYAAAVERAKQTKGSRMFTVRCALCPAAGAAAEVFDSSEGALFLAEIPQPRSAVDATAARGLTGRRAVYPTFGIAVLLERQAEPGMERPTLASCPKGKHGALSIDRGALAEALAAARRRGRAAPVRALPTN